MQIPILVGILSTFLSSDNYVTANELAQKYEMSTRSIYRYVAVLSEGGVPIESQQGRGGGWRIKSKAFRFIFSCVVNPNFTHLS